MFVSNKENFGYRQSMRFMFNGDGFHDKHCAEWKFQDLLWHFHNLESKKGIFYVLSLFI